MAAEKKYTEATGRRKTAVARVRITPASKQSILINERELANFFKTAEQQEKALEALAKSGIEGKFEITVKVSGGGMSAQAESIRHGLARALTDLDPSLRGALKKAGYLTRDQRAVERKKFGLKKARKSPQWSKR